MARRSAAPEIVTIMWRDIPAQVNGQSGRDRHQIILSGKFQRAIDRAKRKAKIYTADEDIAQWNRTSTPCDGDIAAAAEARAAELEGEYSREFLGRLAYVGGFRHDVASLDDTAIDRADLLALEELDEADDAATTEPADPGSSAP